ncbi:MAG: hypothetical protein K0U34_03245, partial [Alphaproteobacteria bacterium]|nr:hypothetical protein [Alphaproteobacteria bacterium]
SDLSAVQDALKNAEAPLMIVGGGPWSKKTQNQIEAFADRFDLPVAAAFRCQDFVDNRHRCYVGHAGIAINANLATAIRGADLLLVIGANLGDITTGHYTLIKAPTPNQTLIHVHTCEDDISKAAAADIAIACQPQAFSAALKKLPSPKKARWAAWRRDLRQAHKASCKPKKTPGAVRLEEVVRQLSKTLHDRSIITNGAGNYTQFVHRYFIYKGFRTCLAPTSWVNGVWPTRRYRSQTCPPKTSRRRICRRRLFDDDHPRTSNCRTIWTAHSDHCRQQQYARHNSHASRPALS